MKCIAKEKGFFNGVLIKPNQTFDAKECPAWAKPLKKNKSEEDVKVQDNTPVEPKEDGIEFKPNEPEEGIIVDDDEPQNESVQNESVNDDLETKTPEEINTILDNLINEGIQANILLDGVENKTPVEQIRELRNLLGYKGE